MSMRRLMARIQGKYSMSRQIVVSNISRPRTRAKQLTMHRAAMKAIFPGAFEAVWD